MNAFEKKHKANLAIYQKSIKDILTAYDQELSLLAGTLFFDPDKPFSFDDYPAAKEKADRLFKEMHDRIQLTVESGIAGEWAYANSKNDALVRSVKGAIENLTDEQVRRYFNSHSGALDAFQKRRVSGLNLSQRVWNITEQNKLELETAIGTALTDGRSAGALSMDVRKYLNEPNKLFRKVRTGTNPDGTPKYRLSKAAQNYHPGQGVYRSSYKNAMRMAGTEINIAYRTADHLRYQDLDFVVGIDVLLSPTNHPDPDICDELKGRYPKEFKFTGWHPHCRCHVETVLKTEEEMDADDERMKQGLPPTETSVNQVTELPQNFQDWVKDNTGKIERAKSTPYFVADNLARKVDADGNVTYVFEKKPKTPKIEPKTPKVDEPAETKKPKAPKPNQGQIEEQLANQLTIEFQEEKQKLFTVAELEEQGVQFSGSVFKKAKDKDKALRESILGDFDFSTVFKDARKKLVELGIKEQDIVCEVELQPITSKIKIFTKGYECNICREFQKKDGKFTVKHALMRLKPEIQGKGLSKEILKTFYEQYKKIGIDEIHVHANLDVGGYCWARYGFSARDQSQVIKAVKGGGGEALKFLKDYYAKTNLQESAPFPMRLIAEQPWGKKALLGNDWQGFISLADKESCAIFERYVGLAGDTAAAAAKPAKKSLLDIAKERHANRTPEQIKKIQEKATLRQEAHKAVDKLEKDLGWIPDLNAEEKLSKFYGKYADLKEEANKMRIETWDKIIDIKTIPASQKEAAIKKYGFEKIEKNDRLIKAWESKWIKPEYGIEEKIKEYEIFFKTSKQSVKFHPEDEYNVQYFGKKIETLKKQLFTEKLDKLKTVKSSNPAYGIQANIVAEKIAKGQIGNAEKALEYLAKMKTDEEALLTAKYNEIKKFSTADGKFMTLKTQVKKSIDSGDYMAAKDGIAKLEEMKAKKEAQAAALKSKKTAAKATPSTPSGTSAMAVNTTEQKAELEVLTCAPEDLNAERQKLIKKLTGANAKEAKEYNHAINGFSYQWDYEIRQVQMGNLSITSYHGHTLKEIQKRAEDLEEFIARAPKWNGGETYRGLNVDKSVIEEFKKKAKNGTPIDMRGTSSWSTQERVAKSFAHSGSEDSQAIFVCNGRQNGTSIRPFSHFEGEHEILCSKDSRWIIKSYKYEKSTDRHYFFVELM